MTAIKIFLLLLLLGGIGLLAAGRLGALQGSAPTDLGVKEGRLKQPSTTQNSVSSQAGLYPDHPMRTYADIDPLPLLQGDRAQTWAAIGRLVRQAPGARVVQDQDGYLRAEFSSPILRFVDDVEFWFDATHQVVQVRSASRLGRKDFGVNRARIEALRAQLAGTAP